MALLSKQTRLSDFKATADAGGPPAEAASALGALLGTLTRNAIVAAGAVVALNLADTLARASGAGPYLPFGLLDSLMGDGDGAPAAAALPLVLAYLGVFAAAVRIWALPRDLT